MKRLRWTPELVDRFWNGVSDTPLLPRFSFARAAAPTIVDLARPWLTDGAKCLDFGGGDGDLCDALLEAGCVASIYEPSAARRARVDERLGGRDGYLGAVDEATTEAFDVVFCLEVVEHVLPALMPDFLARLTSLVRPGGVAIVSCPNSEDLDAGSAYCPQCDAYFHRWQHVRSVEPAALSELLSDAGLPCEWMGLVGFDSVEAFREWRTRRARWDWVRRAVAPFRKSVTVTAGTRAVDLLYGSQSNIFYVGRRAGK